MINNIADSYYNTTRISGKKLVTYEIKATNQEDRVLEFFRARPDDQFTAEDIGTLVLPGTPRTSWGRALTNLTKRNVLEKTDRQTEGAYGRPIYYWRLRHGQQDMFG